MNPSLKWLAACCAWGMCLLTSCGPPSQFGPAQVNHVRVDSAGRALVEADKLLACHDHPIPACQPATQTAQADHWPELRAAIAAAYKTQLAAEVAAARWDAGDKRSWIATEPCLSQALTRVRGALSALGLPVPPALDIIAAPRCGCASCGATSYPYEDPPPQPDACPSALQCK